MYKPQYIKIWDENITFLKKYVKQTLWLFLAHDANITSNFLPSLVLSWALGITIDPKEGINLLYSSWTFSIWNWGRIFKFITLISSHRTETINNVDCYHPKKHSWEWYLASNKPENSKQISYIKIIRTWIFLTQIKLG